MTDKTTLRLINKVILKHDEYVKMIGESYLSKDMQECFIKLLKERIANLK